MPSDEESEKHENVLTLSGGDHQWHHLFALEIDGFGGSPCPGVYQERRPGILLPSGARNSLKTGSFRRRRATDLESKEGPWERGALLPFFQARRRSIPCWTTHAIPASWSKNELRALMYAIWTLGSGLALRHPRAASAVRTLSSFSDSKSRSTFPKAETRCNAKESDSLLLGEAMVLEMLTPTAVSRQSSQTKSVKHERKKWNECPPSQVTQ